MKMMVILGSLFLTFQVQAQVMEKNIEYKIGNQAFEGFLAYKKGTKSKVPGVLVVHDWLGMTEKAKAKTRELAELGYVAFAADIYGKGNLPASQDAAGKLAGQYKRDRKTFREHLTAALDQLRKVEGVDTSKLAAIGFCFGGTGVLELARTGADVKGVVSFHGGLDSPEPALGAKIKGKVLALHGADDPFVQAKDVSAFEDEMRNNHVDWQLVKYGGAVHSFTDKTAGTDNSKGAAYNEHADKRSWAAMKDFFGEIF